MANESKIYRMVKSLSIVLCVGGFIYNTFGTFEKYILAATTVVVTTQNKNELPLPVFVICNDTAYKKIPKDSISNETMWQVKRYLQETRNPAEMQVRLVDFNTQVPVNHTAKMLHTAYYGRCKVIKIEPKVRCILQSLQK